MTIFTTCGVCKISMVARFCRIDCVALAALACYGAAIFPFAPRQVSTVTGTTLCLILTGVLGASAILPRRASGAAWFTAAVAFSMGNGVIGGLILNYVPSGLVQVNWVTFGFLTALISYSVARARGAGSVVEWKRSDGWRLPWLAGAKILGSIAIVAAAIVISITGSNTKDKPFTEVWFVPDGAAHSPVGATGAVFGIKSHESSKEEFIVVMDTGQQVTTHRVMLAPKQMWTHTFAVTGQKPTATVYRGRLTNPVYRTVWFDRR